MILPPHHKWGTTPTSAAQVSRLGTRFMQGRCTSISERRVHTPRNATRHTHSAPNLRANTSHHRVRRVSCASLWATHRCR